MRTLFLPLSMLAALGACTGGGDAGPRTSYTLSGVEPGVFASSSAGNPIGMDRLKGMDERTVAATFGRPVFTRDDGPVRVLRFRSDACDLDLFLYPAGGSRQVRHAEARDPKLRTLNPVDRCAGSVAAQRRSA